MHFSNTLIIEFFLSESSKSKYVKFQYIKVSSLFVKISKETMLENSVIQNLDMSEQINELEIYLKLISFPNSSV